MNFIFVLLLLGFIFFPQSIFAASLYFSTGPQDIYPSDVFVVEARISSPSELINVVDGAFLFDKDKLAVKELSAGGSILSLWARSPFFSNEEGHVSFIGGTPKGFQGEDSLILKAIFTAKKEGEVKLTFTDDSSVFLSDGKGTKISPQKKSLTLSILQRPPQIPPRDEWQALVKEDRTPPEFIEAIISRNPRLFDNQYFVSFFAVDKESGIDYYEIKEGDLDFVRAESPYLLKYQSLKSAVQIKAVDKAGNENVVTPEFAPVPEVPYKKYLIWIFVVFVVLILFYGFRRLFKTKTTGNIQK